MRRVNDMDRMKKKGGWEKEEVQGQQVGKRKCKVSHEAGQQQGKDENMSVRVCLPWGKMQVIHTFFCNDNNYR